MVWSPCQGDALAIDVIRQKKFDQILSKLEGTCGPARGLLWTPLFVQLLDTTEKMRNDARLPVG